MYTKNKIGPSTEPCGTLLKTDVQQETSQSTTTLCLLSVSHCSIQLIILFPISCAFNLRIWKFARNAMQHFLYEILSGNPNRLDLHLPVTHHQPT